MALNLSKQALLIDDAKVKKYTIHIFGLGSIGSHLGRALCKTGFVNIVGYDFDSVDNDNISAQAYSPKHEGLKKTEAFKQMLIEETGVEPIVYDGKVDEKTEIKIEANSIYFVAFDSIPARKLVWDKVKNFPVPYGETRIGMFDYRFYFVVPGKTPMDWKFGYEKLLDPNQPMTELKCGEKCSFGPNTCLVSLVLRQMLNIIEEKDIIYSYIGNWLTPDNIVIKSTWLDKQQEEEKEEVELSEFEKDLKIVEEII